MDEYEVAEALADLETFLSRVGLGALVEQERSLAQSVAPAGEATAGAMPESGLARKKGEFVLTSLGTRDRLGVLLDLVEGAVVGQLLVERAVRASVEDLRQHGLLGEPTVTFDDPHDEGDVAEPYADDLFQPFEPAASRTKHTGAQDTVPPTSWSLDSSGENDRGEHVEALVHIVRKLRRQLGVDHADWLDQAPSSVWDDVRWPA